MRRKLLYAEVCLRLLGAWLLVRCAPFKLWRVQLRQSPRVKPLADLTATDLAFLADIQHVFWQIKWASRDRATCLMMVLVARWMLNRQGISGTVYLGICRDSAKPGLHAHAWMQSAIGVVGHEEVQCFVVVESFGG